MISAGERQGWWRHMNEAGTHDDDRTPEPEPTRPKRSGSTHEDDRTLSTDRTQAILRHVLQQAALLALDVSTDMSEHARSADEAGAIMADVATRARKVCSDPNCGQLQPCVDHPANATTPSWAGRSGRRDRMRSGSREQRRARWVLNRDAGICHVCGRWGANEVDHVQPLCEDGQDVIDNLAAIHSQPCHANKSNAERQRARARARADT